MLMPPFPRPIEPRSKWCFALAALVPLSLAAECASSAPHPAAPSGVTQKTAESGGAAAAKDSGSVNAAGASDGPTSGVYTYCKQVCKKLSACKDVSFGDLPCDRACAEDMNDNPEDAVPHFECALAHQSCSDLTGCFADGTWPSDAARIASCRTYCGVVSGRCRGKFPEPRPHQVTAGSIPVPGPADDCILDCADDTFNGPAGRAALSNVLCVNASASCGEAEQCTAILDAYDDRLAKAGSQRCSGANYSRLHRKCSSDADCCPSSAYSTHCGPNRICVH